MKKFEYTYTDIADASGKTVNHVRVDVTRGKLVPDALDSVSVYVAQAVLEKYGIDGSPKIKA